MNYIELADNIKSPSHQILSMMWKFVTKDIDNEFEQWVYSSNELKSLLNENAYYMLISTDYRSKDEVFYLRRLCFNFIAKFRLDCLCLTFPSNMLLYPFWEEASQLKEHIETLNKLLIVEDFSGRPPVFLSRWYHPAELYQCQHCKQDYLVLFEESEGADFYVLKLKEQEANIVLNNPTWPNKNWPKRLSAWDEFNQIKFISWHELYTPLNIKSHDLKNFMLNYQYGHLG